MKKIFNLTMLAVSLIAYTSSANADIWHKIWRDHNSEIIQDGLNALKSNKSLVKKILKKLLKEMPKGADLHSHLSGAVTMEHLIAWGAEDGLCVDSKTYTASNGPCTADQIPLANTKNDPNLYKSVLGAWSMEGAPATLLGAHQHFFDAFGKFNAVLSDARLDDALADILSTAGNNNQIYVELMQGMGSSAIGNIAKNYMQLTDTWTEAYLLEKRQQLIADPLFATTLQTNSNNMKAYLEGARQLLGCNTINPDPGCNVGVRFIISANRTRDRNSVFAQWVYAYEFAQATQQVVGINLVSPEEHPNSLLYYDDEMMALDVLRRLNEKDAKRNPVHIGLHAGELIPEVLPNTPEGQRHLTFHIKHAVEIAHAERIGHGSDLLNEIGAGATDLLTTMREQNVAVEACLTSNAALLGKIGKTHPLRTYLKHRVPSVLATDDQGIFRINITDEFVKAVTEQHLKYRTLKNLVRASLEHSFLPGKSLWRKANDYGNVVKACQKDVANQSKPSTACAEWLASSERATMQWQLEAQFNDFENKLIKKLNDF
jgi:adenosine deaminase